MSKYRNNLLICLILALLVACSSTPEPQPAPEPEPVVEAAVAAPEPLPEPEPEPEPVDFNQQFYLEAVAALKSGDAALAVELLLKVSQDAPDKPYVFTNLGLAYFKLQKIDLAETAFKQALERNKRDAVAFNHLGILQRQKGEFAEALKSYQRAIQIDSDYARAHLNLGILFDIYLQDLQKALKQYQKYQSLISEQDKQVAGWIVDIERQLKSASSKS